MQAVIRGFLVRRVYHKDVANMLKNIDLKTSIPALGSKTEEEKESYESMQKQLKVLASLFNADPSNYL